MWPSISQDSRVIQHSPAGYGFGWQLPLWCPGAGVGPMEAYFEGSISDKIGEKEIRRLGMAILARALRDALSENGERRAARRWLRSGEALLWAQALNMRITQQMINDWLKSPAIPDQRGVHQRKKEVK
jgi:hypothetical protein